MQTTEFKLNSNDVTTLFDACLFARGDQGHQHVIIRGTYGFSSFHHGRVTANRQLIVDMLAELPDIFRSDASGGCTLNDLKQDRYGRTWTSSRKNAEQLIRLGLAAGLVEWSEPRDIWELFLGHLPCFALTM